MKLPVIPIVIQWVPDTLRHPLRNSILFLRKNSVCSCGCGEPDVVAVIDYDTIRCFDYFLPIGEYVNRREWDDGINAYVEMTMYDATVQ